MTKYIRKRNSRKPWIWTYNDVGKFWNNWNAVWRFFLIPKYQLLSLYLPLIGTSLLLKVLSLDWYWTTACQMKAIDKPQSPKNKVHSMIVKHFLKAAIFRPVMDYYWTIKEQHYIFPLIIFLTNVSMITHV